MNPLLWPGKPFKRWCLHVGVCLLLWVCSGWALAQKEGSESKAYLATMEPGPLYFENFGHNSLIIERAGRRPVSYNFGYFDFESKGFLRNFIFGKMQYLGVVIDAERDLGSYVQDGRGVWLDQLNLTEVQIDRLEQHLITQTQPPNDVYRYDYFRANCSTKIRDALNFALDGQLQRQLEHRSHGYTFRSLGLAHAKLTPWQYLGIHAGLGPSTDLSLSIWQESFIPAGLRNAALTIKVQTSDGLQPLILDSQRLHKHQSQAAQSALDKYESQLGQSALDKDKSQAAPSALDRDKSQVAQSALDKRQSQAEIARKLPTESTLPTLPATRLVFFCVGMSMAILISIGFRWRSIAASRMLSSVIAISTCAAVGAGGLLLTFLWSFTDHQDAYWNLNLLLFSPLALALLPCLWRSWQRSWQPSDSARTISGCFLLSVASCALLKTLPMVRQVNLEWLLLVAPISIALHYATNGLGRSKSS